LLCLTRERSSSERPFSLTTLCEFKPLFWDLKS
jgi:hypothetical protein